MLAWELCVVVDEDPIINVPFARLVSSVAFPTGLVIVAVTEPFAYEKRVDEFIPTVTTSVAFCFMVVPSTGVPPVIMLQTLVALRRG